MGQRGSEVTPTSKGLEIPNGLIVGLGPGRWNIAWCRQGDWSQRVRTDLIQKETDYLLPIPYEPIKPQEHMKMQKGHQIRLKTVIISA